jgi:hypothetical protein
VKTEHEFFDPLRSAEHSWHPAPGDLTGQLEEMILSCDEATGDLTRLLRFAPGADTTPNGTLTHEVWEEVWILEGSLTDVRLGELFRAGTYACRPPGMEHGPWIAPEGAMTLEIRYREPQGWSES